MKRFPYKMVIFDVDGTLLDTSEGLLSAIKYAIKKHHLRELSEEQLLTFIGPPVQDSFRKYYDLSEEEIQNVSTTFRNHYKDVDLYKAKPYEGVFDVFEQLNSIGVVTAIATYKREDYAIMLMKYFHFNQYTDIIYGADNFNKLKKSDIIRKCMEQVEYISKSEILVVGDSNSDGIGAKANGCDFCGVTFGFGAKNPGDFTVQTDYLIGSMKELLTIA